MGLAVRSVDLYVLNMRTRMPFRYGIASMTALPHLFVRAELDVDGHRRSGIAADGLPPKWFTKDPTTSFRDDLADMFQVIRAACAFAQEMPEATTVFDLWLQVYHQQKRWAAERGYPPLLWNFGVSLVERAIIDAFCRAKAIPFATAVRSNMLGIRLGDLYQELAGLSPAELLPQKPLRSLIARHTVGLADPLTDDEIPADERLDDGLPQSLAASIRAYGLSYFKIKVRGDLPQDRERLRHIAAVIHNSGLTAYAFTLDGNEQFHTVAAFRQFWQRLTDDPELRPFFRHLLFVEQPLHRDMALSPRAGEALRRWTDRPPIIIDESDGQIGDLAAALACGYAGTSHKNCKGIFKGIANACLIEHRRRLYADGGYILSGEDLANVGPVALLQDLAVMANLGVEHVERNGHHYFAGLSMLPDDLQSQVLTHHGDLYHRHARGFATLRIRDGRIDVGSLVDAPFGLAFEMDPSRFTPLDMWRFDSLGIRTEEQPEDPKSRKE